MKLIRLQENYAKRAKCFCVTEENVVFSTGQKLIVYDKKFNILKEIDNLDHVYRIVLSPNKKELLLISSKNIFYIFELFDFSIKKFVVKGKYNGNLETRGCWSPNGKEVLLLVQNRKTLSSALRIYNLSDMSHSDFLENRYQLSFISFSNNKEKYLLIGNDIEKTQNDCYDSLQMIWFDGQSFEFIPLKEMYDEPIKKVHYEKDSNIVYIYGFEKVARFSENGKFLGFVKYNVEDVNHICLSTDEKYLYLASKTGISVIDPKDNSVVASQKIEFGAQDIKEISNGIVLVTTWHGIQLYEIIQDL